MELLNLRYFMAVAQYKNFTKAARCTFTSQSNISKQIALLEKELGVSLFVREKAGVTLTAAGQHLQQGLHTLLPQLDDLLERTSEIQNHESKLTLRLGLCTAMDLERIIPNFISKLQNEHGDISIEFSTFPFSEAAERLIAGTVDCAFIFNVSRFDIPDSVYLPVNRNNPRLYFSEKHPLFGKPDLSVEDFRDEVFIKLIFDPVCIDQYEALPFTPKHILREKSINNAFPYIFSGTAVAVFGPSQSMLSRTDIHTIELPTKHKVGTDAVWLSSNTNPALTEFIQFLKERQPEF